MSALADTLRSWASVEVVERRGARAGVWVVAFVVATSLAAQVAVPLPWTPVPMTLQPLLVLLAGALLGARLGASALALYLAVGAAGAPVFAGGGAGIPWLMGPTGGYLIAMPAAAFVAGAVISPGAGAARSIAGLLLGLSCLYAGGLSQLFLLTGRGVGPLLAEGMLPFLVGDLTKVALAFVLVRAVGPGRLGRP